jgi:alpha-N-arabinofuranosidase
VNVLQAMILTDKEKMLVTPTYWVFEMFKGHQGGTVIPADIQSPDYVPGDAKVPALSASATRDASGAILLSLVNSDPGKALSVSVSLPGAAGKSLSGRVLTARGMQAHNTFDAPDAVKPAAFSGFKKDGDSLKVELPAKSIITLEIR